MFEVIQYQICRYETYAGVSNAQPCGRPQNEEQQTDGCYEDSTYTHTHTNTYKYIQSHTHRTEVLISVLWAPSKSRKQRNYTRFCKYYSSSRSLSFPFACNYFPSYVVLCFEAFVQCEQNVLPRANRNVNR